LANSQAQKSDISKCNIDKDIKELDIDKLTPIDALNKLCELKSKIK